MKFFGAILAYVIMGLLLAWGLLLAATGSYWLLAVAFVAYLTAFFRIGCLPSDQH